MRYHSGKGVGLSRPLRLAARAQLFIERQCVIGRPLEGIVMNGVEIIHIVAVGYILTLTQCQLSRHGIPDGQNHSIGILGIQKRFGIQCHLKIHHCLKPFVGRRSATMSRIQTNTQS